MEPRKLSLYLCSLCLASVGFTEGTCEINAEVGRHTFGQNCNYLCRCENTGTPCDLAVPSGECPQGICQLGWMGPACQYRNVAYHSTTDTTNVVDGNTSTCARHSANVDLDLGDVYPVQKITLVYDMYDMKGINSSVWIKKSSIDEWTVCSNAVASNNNTIYVQCEEMTQAQIVRVNRGSSLAHLCEIMISAGRSVAYNRIASQSSNSSSTVGMAPVAVDGTSGQGLWENPKGHYGKTCTHTKNGTNLWWMVDLGSLYNIFWFRIYNRLDCCQNRLKKFTLYVSNESKPYSWIKLYEDTRTSLMNIPDPIIITNVTWMIGRFVRIALPDFSEALTLCEVEIFADCPENKCGTACNESCYCRFGSQRNAFHGICSEGCQPGWTGENNKCNKECEDGNYGSNCELSCGQCKKGVCNRVDGRCTEDGCAFGWTGFFCNQTCPENKCGIACNERCYCRLGSQRDTFHGICLEGCQPGWTGENNKCNKECEDGNYGSNCELLCGQCKKGPCNRVDGRCTEDGCASGLTGFYCNQSCPENKCGITCNESCYCRIGSERDTLHGICIEGCQPGWTGENNKCNKECEDGNYGINCELVCGQCKKGPCNHVDGRCTEDGCVPGWTGFHCNQGQDQNQSGAEEEPAASVPGIAGGICAAVFVILILVIIVILCRRHRRRNRDGEEQLPDQRGFSFNKEKGSIYENAGILQDSGINKPTSTTETPKSQVPAEEDQTYYNEHSKIEPISRNAVLLSDLWDYVQSKISSMTSVEKEFKTLPLGLQHPTTAAKKPKNIQKNRYKNLYAYDHSRVHLSPDAADDGDYVNACFVDGFRKPKAFIAAQGATSNNMNDIWRMVWQQNCGKIIMLTNLSEHGVTKCEQYWPDEGEKQYGSINVIIQECDNFADCVIRTLRVSHKIENRSKTVRQFHYTAWPDKDVPGVASSLVQFWNKVSHTTCPVKGPVLVHCSAGIGRTGTYIALDYLVEQGRKEGYVDFPDCIKKIRAQRVNLVQTKEQYLFVHEAVVEALMLSGTGIASDQFPKTYNDLQQIDVTKKQTKLFFEFERLRQANPFDRQQVNLADDEDGSVTHMVDEYTTAKRPENSHKNRYSNILAADTYRPCLTNPPKGSTDYINAVYMPSHRDRSAFIITQMPLQSTVEDFWVLVQEEEIMTIVMMNIHNQRTQSESAAYWPEQNPVTYGDFTIKTTDSNRQTGFKTRDIRWTRNSTGDTSTLRQFQFLSWPETAKVPTDHSSILLLFEAIMQWQRLIHSGPILVHCMDGAERSGLFCVLSTIIERLNIERDVAVAQTIKKMRIIRQQIIPNYEQFQFCHDVVLEYLKTFDTYSNFA